MRPVDGPFAITLHQHNTARLYCLNEAAEQHGLHRGMRYSDARAYCPDLLSRSANRVADGRFLQGLRRWATRYCPWVGLEGDDGLVLDITGTAHLWSSEEAMLADIRQRCARARINVRIGLADTRGAAWALAHHAEGIAPSGDMSALDALPVAALRLDQKTSVALQRLGLRCVGDVASAPRASLLRRFGPNILMRLDQAFGQQAESITPLADPPHYGVRMTLPEPIGLASDVMAGASRLLERLCEKLKAQQMGARVLELTLRRVDQETKTVELRLARPMRDAARILPLFERGVAEVDAGFGIDQLRVVASVVEALPAQQVTAIGINNHDKLNDMLTALGTRIGLDNIIRFLPAESHIPERGFLTVPVSYSDAAQTGWATALPRPLRLFPPEPIMAANMPFPKRFRWRRMLFTIASASGPERIAPEWWLQDDNWRMGLRDYWRVQTGQGQRLWLFYTPQNPGWFIHGEFA